jgi:hypothetical protein
MKQIVLLAACAIFTAVLVFARTTTPAAPPALVVTGFLFALIVAATVVAQERLRILWLGAAEVVEAVVAVTLLAVAAMAALRMPTWHWVLWPTFAAGLVTLVASLLAPPPAATREAHG